MLISAFQKPNLDVEMLEMCAFPYVHCVERDYLGGSRLRRDEQIPLVALALSTPHTIRYFLSFGFGEAPLNSSQLQVVRVLKEKNRETDCSTKGVLPFWKR